MDGEGLEVGGGEMNHKWEKLPDKVHVGIGTFGVWKCKTCGCIKSLGRYKFATPDYERNGQLYDYYIECIDYEAENLKTID